MVVSAKRRAQPGPDSAQCSAWSSQKHEQFSNAAPGDHGTSDDTVGLHGLSAAVPAFTLPLPRARSALWSPLVPKHRCRHQPLHRQRPALLRQGMNPLLVLLRRPRRAKGE
ncbi:hypothetical protein PHYPSEUDO_006747 [Phytophthora pseudosyringae]|uniref:Uncharacterized protein n=1 Tax=Phytophthora pseudosyringae TaxID=221518 RepID=A0A8T1VN94_9STRA|nr:hypothetical protein PHYPSEUDO_006747 [Phytophthora pseudosyringae]